MHFITLSQMLGTDGERIARKVAGDLPYAFYGEQEFFKAAEELGVLADCKKVDEKAPSFLERLFSEKPKVHLAAPLPKAWGEFSTAKRQEAKGTAVHRGPKWFRIDFTKST